MFIRKLIEFDKMELSTNKLIFLKYRVRWMVIVCLFFIALGFFAFLILFSQNYLLKLLYFSLMVLCLCTSMIYSKPKIFVILRMYCIRYNIKTNHIWKERNFVIEELQLKKLSFFLSQHSSINDIKFIIESLRSENNIPKYKYHFFAVFSTLFSVLTGAFLSAIIALPNMFKTWSNVMTFFKPVTGFSILIILFTWFSEEMLFKGIFRLSANRHTRLIRILEEYYLRAQK